MGTSLPAASRFHHVSLSVADLDAAERWYQQALGLTDVIERFELPEPAVRTVVLQGASGLRVELIGRAASVRARTATRWTRRWPRDTATGRSRSTTWTRRSLT